MKTIPLTDLYARAKDRPDGYVSDVLAMAVSVTDTHYTLTADAYRSLCRKYRPMPIPADYDPDTSHDSPRKGSCCDPPRPTS